MKIGVICAMDSEFRQLAGRMAERTESSDGLFTTVCSYGGDLVLGSVSALRSTNILRNFYRSLAESGLAVTLYASEVETE